MEEGVTDRGETDGRAMDESGTEQGEPNESKSKSGEDTGEKQKGEIGTDRVVSDLKEEEEDKHLEKWKQRGNSDTQELDRKGRAIKREGQVY